MAPVHRGIAEVPEVPATVRSRYHAEGQLHRLTRGPLRRRAMTRVPKAPACAACGLCQKPVKCLRTRCSLGLPSETSYLFIWSNACFELPSSSSTSSSPRLSILLALFLLPCSCAVAQAFASASWCCDGCSSSRFTKHSPGTASSMSLSLEDHNQLAEGAEASCLHLHSLEATKEI